MKKVSVIAISFNHEAYIKEALASVFAQTRANIELIVMDDGSEDNSQAVISELLKDKDCETVLHKSNEGYKKTFNEGLALATGDYIVDFALDDVMKPDFLEQSITALEKAGEDYGVSFSNAEYIDRDSKITVVHTEWLKAQGIIDWVPQGDVFQMLLKRYFICTPSMVIRKSVFDRLRGYDNELAYEDFDFWVRSSRNWKYIYVDQVLIQKRKLTNSMSAQRYLHSTNGQMKSVFQVCEKAASLCDSRTDYKALSVRLNYEFRQCLRFRNWDLANAYMLLLRSNRLNLDLASLSLNWFGIRLKLKLK